MKLYIIYSSSLVLDSPRTFYRGGGGVLFSFGGVELELEGCVRVVCVVKPADWCWSGK